jgi:hypothetical protein
MNTLNKVLLLVNPLYSHNSFKNACSFVFTRTSAFVAHGLQIQFIRFRFCSPALASLQRFAAILLLKLHPRQRRFWFFLHVPLRCIFATQIKSLCSCNVNTSVSLSHETFTELSILIAHGEHLTVLYPGKKA